MRAILAAVFGERPVVETSEITMWLDAAREGDRAALDRVLATLYQELHTMARRQLAVAADGVVGTVVAWWKV